MIFATPKASRSIVEEENEQGRRCGLAVNLSHPTQLS